ncbi:hypothetical protein AAFF_G00352320 [Aldrovandia affinis]|uniref:Uncharacterized protein n=1 Tax=Aldrovandia affinis TaxID=143900 RepID=A0AAD7SIV2_9TELE|nr:hypothetical protein AAFF_G00352320 [Aldrovandia affinis]
MARLGWCLAAVISWGKFFFSCFFPVRAARRDKVNVTLKRFQRGRRPLCGDVCIKGPWGTVGPPFLQNQPDRTSTAPAFRCTDLPLNQASTIHTSNV